MTSTQLYRRPLWGKAVKDWLAARFDRPVQSPKSQLTGLANKDKEFQTILDRSTQRMFDQLKATIDSALPDYFESMARAYARDFSPDDLKAILAFVKTPAGQRYFARAPLILKDPDVQASGQRMTAQLFAKLPEITRENKRDIDDYVARTAKQAKPAAAKPVT